MHIAVGLQARLAILVVAALLPAAALVLWTDWRAVQATREQALAQLRFEAGLLAVHHEGLGHLPADQRDAAVLRAQAQLPEGTQLLLLDRQARVLLAHPREPTGSTLDLLGHPQARAAVAGMRPFSGELASNAAPRRLVALAPSGATGAGQVLVVLSRPAAQALAPASALLWAHTAIGAATLAAAAAVTWRLTRRAWVRPTRRMAAAMEQVEAGRLEALAPDGSSAAGELGRLERAFNRMVVALQSQGADRAAELAQARAAHQVVAQVLATMPQGVVAVDGDGQLLLYNDAALRLLPLEGLSGPAAQWAARLGLFAADGQAPLAPEALPLVRGLRGETGQAQVWVRNERTPAQGRLLQWRFQPLPGAGGPPGALAVLDDLTEPHQVQADQTQQLERLRQSDAQLRDFTGMLQRSVEAAKSIAAVHSVEQMLQQVADRARQVVGAHQAAITLADPQGGEPLGAASFSDKWAAWHRRKPAPRGCGIYALAGETGRPLRLAEAELRAHPRYRGAGNGEDDHPPLRGLLVVPLVTRDGRPSGFLMLSDRLEGDFTERDEYVATHLAQLSCVAIENARLLATVRELNAGLEGRIARRTAQLSAQEARFRALVEQAPQVIWESDAQGNLTFVSRAWTDLVGGSAEGWLGQRWMARLHPDDLQAVASNWARSRDRVAPFTGTRRVLGQDGRWHTTAYRATPVLDAGGRPQFWVGIDTDITELKAIENALRSSNDELEAFSYSVSHDLRAPLGAIGGFSRALAMRHEGAADDKTRHYLERIQAGVDKMEHLIEALLSLARLVRAPLQHGPVDLTGLAHELLEALRAQQPGRVVEQVVEPGLTAQADEQLVRVALTNLLGNAWKFSARQPVARIEVGRDPHGAFYVRDNGAGFDMAYAAKLFGPFQRLHTEAEFAGTGIGLAIVQRIIARHEGRVWARSAPGEGSTFYFTLPRSAPR